MTLRLVVRFAAVALVCAAVASCQSEGAEWKKRFDDSTLKPPASAVQENFGKGPVEITLLVPRGSTGIYDNETRDVRDGAALAAAELGDAYVTVRVVDTSGGAEAAKTAGEAAASRKPALFLSYNTPEVTNALASIPATGRPSIINLSQAVAGQNVFNFQRNEVETAAKAVAGASASVKKAILVLAPIGFSTEQEQRLANLIQQAGGQITGVVRYEAGDSAVEAVASNTETVKKASAIVVLGSNVAVRDILMSVNKLNPTAQILGTDAWPPVAYAVSAANGALIAASDQEGSALIADRYKRHKGRALTPNAARAYDSVAIGSGLVRAGGAEALTASALVAPSGFRGVNGVFRFTPNGSTDWQLGLYKVAGGKLVPVQAAKGSF